MHQPQLPPATPPLLLPPNPRPTCVLPRRLCAHQQLPPPLFLFAAAAPTDFARTNNINGIITGLWPSVAQAIKEDLVMTMVSDSEHTVRMLETGGDDWGAGCGVGGGASLSCGPQWHRQG
jgi:hypothetical protein